MQVFQSRTVSDSQLLAGHMIGSMQFMWRSSTSEVFTCVETEVGWFCAAGAGIVGFGLANLVGLLRNLATIRQTLAMGASSECR